MQALIDGDLIAYRCAASAELDDLGIALIRADELIFRILADTNASSYRVFLGGRENFRKYIYPEYKANRTKPKPIHLAETISHLISEWKAEVQHGIETDDRLGIELNPNSICCSIDKDLLQIPGNHYNFVKQQMIYISEETADYNFYRQFLIGDASDNIFGIYGIGEKKAEGILFGESPANMFVKVRELYNDDKRMLINGQCLHIWRHNFDLWNPQILVESTGIDNSKLVSGVLSKSGPLKIQESSQLLEPTGQETSGALPLGDILADGEMVLETP